MAKKSGEGVVALALIFGAVLGSVFLIKALLAPRVVVQLYVCQNSAAKTAFLLLTASKRKFCRLRT